MAVSANQERILHLHHIRGTFDRALLLGVSGAIGGGFQAVSYYAFWLAVLAWLVMIAGVAFKGI